MNGGRHSPASPGSRACTCVCVAEVNRGRCGWVLNENEGYDDCDHGSSSRSSSCSDSRGGSRSSDRRSSNIMTILMIMIKACPPEEGAEGLAIFDTKYNDCNLMRQKWNSDTCPHHMKEWTVLAVFGTYIIIVNSYNNILNNK